MESHLDLVLQSSVQKLQEITEEIRGLLMLHAVIESLLGELKQMRWLVKNGGVQTREELWDVRTLIYEAEDGIDEILCDGLEFQLIHQKERSMKGWLGTVEKYLTGFKLMGFKYILGSGIESLIPRIRVVNHGLLAYQASVNAGKLPGQVSASGDSDDHPPFADKRNSIDLESFWKYEEDSILGMEDGKEMVSSLLLEEEEGASGVGGKGLKVVAIYGMGGIGKTTLAKSVYNYYLVRRHFDCFAWASVGRSFQTRLVYQDLLLSLSSHSREEMMLFSDLDLAGMVYSLLQSKRYLIVLDDVWETDVWDCLNIAFPSSEKKGSRVLVTTRAVEVAQITASKDGFLYQMSGLNQEQSLNLLFTTAFRTQSPGSGFVGKLNQALFDKYILSRIW